jgi:hypothetical protein
MAAAAVGLMGEGAECVPAAIVRGWPDSVFNDTPGQDGFVIPGEEDISRRSQRASLSSAADRCPCRNLDFRTKPSVRFPPTADARPYLEPTALVDPTRTFLRAGVRSAHAPKQPSGRFSETDRMGTLLSSEAGSRVAAVSLLPTLQIVLRQPPFECLDTALPEERFILERHQWHAPVTAAFLRLFVSGYERLIAIRVLRYRVLQFGEIETCSRNGVCEVITAMPVGGAAEDRRMTSFSSASPCRVRPKRPRAGSTCRYEAAQSPPHLFAGSSRSGPASARRTACPAFSLCALRRR